MVVSGPGPYGRPQHRLLARAPPNSSRVSAGSNGDRTAINDFVVATEHPNGIVKFFVRPDRQQTLDPEGEPALLNRSAPEPITATGRIV